MKIWIARDSAKYEDESLRHFVERHPEQEYQFGELHLFYDKPAYTKGQWQYGRTAADIPSYMFPLIGCGECLEFDAEDSYPDYLHYEGVVFTKRLKEESESQ